MSNLAHSFNHHSFWHGYQEAWGHRLYAPSMDRWLYLKLHRLGLMGALEKKVIEKMVLPGSHAIDVGCNIGLYASHMSQTTGREGWVTAFEPMTELHGAIQRAIQDNGISNIELLPYALGSRDGVVQMCPNSLNSGDNQVILTEGTSSGREVPQRRLDGLDLRKPTGFIKIDVQGWEVEVLRGVSGLMSRQPLPTLFCEVSEVMLRRANTSAAEMGQVILDYGYDLYLPSLQGSELSLEKFSLEQVIERSRQKSYFDLVAMPAGKKPDSVRIT